MVSPGNIYTNNIETEPIVFRSVCMCVCVSIHIYIYIYMYVYACNNYEERGHEFERRQGRIYERTGGGEK